MTKKSIKSIEMETIKADKISQDMRYKTPVEFSENVKELDKILMGKLNNREIITDFQYAVSSERLGMEVPNDYKLWIRKGLALEEQMLYADAVNIYSDGLEYNTFCDTLYECRGHIYITLGRYHEAVADSTMCVRINPLNWYGWYHKGLGHYFMGQYEDAVKAFKGCLYYSFDENRHSTAAIDWSYICLMHLGKVTEAENMLSDISEKTPDDEGALYKTRLLIYKGIRDTEKTLSDIPKDDDFDLVYTSLGFAVAMKYYFNGDIEKAKVQLMDVMKRDKSWQGFGYLASRLELGRLFNIQL